jgi:hypothetical protein
VVLIDDTYCRFQLKAAANVENKYNQNFYGVYCTCGKPYPDPEGDEDDMLQCAICEDWYHLKVSMPFYIIFLIRISYISQILNISLQTFLLLFTML